MHYWNMVLCRRNIGRQICLWWLFLVAPWRHLGTRHKTAIESCSASEACRVGIAILIKFFHQHRCFIETCFYVEEISEGKYYFGEFFLCLSMCVTYFLKFACMLKFQHTSTMIFVSIIFTNVFWINYIFFSFLLRSIPSFL